MLCRFPGSAVSHEIVDRCESVNKMTPLFAIDEKVLVKVVVNVLIEENEFLFQRATVKVI